MADVEFQDFIDEVIQKNDIVELISEYAKPKRMGNRYAALCPLHNDKKSPSLSISPDKQVFHCFGCGAGGNVIHFVMAAEHLDFMDAVRLLADRAGIPFPEFSGGGGKARENTDKKQLIYKMNADAARYFYQNLAGEKGKTALEYLKNRGIKNSTIKMFGLGYAPEGWTLLIDYLRQKGYKEHDMYEAGLAKMRDNGTYYDSFYDGRVMFPIINVQGNIIGFGGRTMVDRKDINKYMNTPETLVFKKKENLFGLNFAKNNNSGSLLLMEGYMDVISLHQAGITNAVASLGTAFTEEQAKLVKRYGGKAILCYDSDGPGKQATLRAGEVLTNAGIRTRVMTVTDGKDPDEFIRAKGGDMFQVLIEGAKPLVEYRVEEIRNKYFDDDETESIDTERMIEFTEKVSEVLAEIKNPVEYEVYSKKVLETTGISAEALNSQVSNIRNAKLRAEERRDEQRAKRISRIQTPEGKTDLRVYNAEALMLCLLCDTEVYKIAKGSGLTAEHFSDTLHRRLAECIFGLYDENGAVDINLIFDSFEEENRGRIAKILLDDKNTRDKKKACEMPLKTLIGEVEAASQQELLDKGDLAALDKLLREKRKKNQN